MQAGGAKAFESGCARLEGASAAGGASGGTAVCKAAAESGSLRGNFEGGSLGGVAADSGSAGNSGVISAIIRFGPEVASC